MWLQILKYGLPILVFCGIVFAIYHYGYNQGLEHGKTLQDIAVIAQRGADNAECDKDKELTSNVSNEYEKDLTASYDDLAAAKLQSGKATSNIVSVTGQTNGSDATDNADKSNKADAITVKASNLYDYSGECEKDRLKVLALQDFINRVWAAKGQ